MSLMDRLRGMRQPVRIAPPVETVQLPAMPEDVAALQAQLRRTQEELHTTRAQLAVRLGEVEELRRREAILDHQAAAAEHRAVQAVAAADALRLRLNDPDRPYAELDRALRTLHDYEGQLATCREHHGTNSRPSHYPDPCTGVPA